MGAIETSIEATWCTRSACTSSVGDIVSRICLVATELVHGLDEGATRFAELDHAWLQVVQRALNKGVILLVMRKKIMPKWVL